MPPPFGEEVVDSSATQAQAVVKPDGVTDNGSGTAVFAIAGQRTRHRPTLLSKASTTKQLAQPAQHVVADCAADHNRPLVSFVVVSPDIGT